MVKFHTTLSISGEDERQVQLREKSLIKQTVKKQFLETKAGDLGVCNRSVGLQTPF